MSQYTEFQDRVSVEACTTCGGLGYTTDAEPGDISYNTKPCMACNTTGFKRSYYPIQEIQPDSFIEVYDKDEYYRYYLRKHEKGFVYFQGISPAQLEVRLVNPRFKVVIFDGQPREEIEDVEFIFGRSIVKAKLLKTAMTPLNLVTDDMLHYEINTRRQLMAVMVGGLYPAIMQEEILKLQERARCVVK